MTGPADILDFWHAVELFSPQPVPRLRDSRQDEPIVEWSPEQAAPWEPGQPLRRRSPRRSETTWRHFVYLGVFELEQAVLALEQRFGRAPESWREQVGGQSCLAAVAISDAGRPLVDSYTLSSLAWALGRVCKAGDGGPDLDGFHAAQETAREAFASRMALLPDDEEGQRLTGYGFRVGPEIDAVAVGRELGHLLRTQGWPSAASDLLHPALVRSTAVSRRKKWSIDDLDFLNSLFLGDLRRVGRAFEAGERGEALGSYLSLPDAAQVAARRDVRRDDELVFAALAPRRFPLARWPSPGGWPLVFSQQLAVNEAWQSLAEGRGLFAINGPPGTGKTTLLRDLVAAVVVRRADALAALDRSADAFVGRAGWWQASGYRVSVQALRPELTGHEIVVASSNNGAVENVTREIPQVSAVDAAELQGLSYFPEVGSAVLGEPAWGLLAAPLGNKQNRSRFVTRFWFGPDAGEEGADAADSLGRSTRAMRDLLRDAEERPPPSWRKAVARYRQVRSEVERLAAERQRIAEVLERFPGLERAVEEAARAASTASSAAAEADAAHRLDVETAEAEAARVAAAEARHAAHRRARPSFLEVVLSGLRAWREWRRDDVELRERSRRARHAHQLAGERVARSAEVSRRAAGRREEALRAQCAAGDRRATALSTLDEFRQRYPETFVPGVSAESPEQRERSSPWVDAEWNRWRSRLFLAALGLHRDLILCEPTSFRRNLQGAVEILSGKVSSGAPLPALKAAWATLFLVVPVISTAFASVDRLFACLGREDLGWLFVDEAGQAVPQAAVGAIWRSRRVVVVGDPMQLEPIVTLPVRALEVLRRRFEVAPEWRPDSGSVQHLADRRNPVGTHLRQGEEELWIGVPLRAHRRCDEPMFSIANRISYDGLMVYGTPERPPPDGWPASGWLDVATTTSEGNWVPEEGELVVRLLAVLAGDRIESLAGRVVVISPFRHVIAGLRRLLGSGSDGKIDVATVHRVQGKEADAVVLVLGGSVHREGALDWAARRPNLLNVAVTRARRRLYVVGDRARWRRRRYFSELARGLPVLSEEALTRRL